MIASWNAAASTAAQHWHGLSSRLGADIVPAGPNHVLSAIVLTVFATLLSSVGYLLWKQQTDRRRLRPEAIFGSLCRIHRLNRRQCRNLKALAKAIRLSDPAILFVDPRSFQLAVEAGKVDLCREETRELQSRLFD